MNSYIWGKKDISVRRIFNGWLTTFTFHDTWTGPEGHTLEIVFRNIYDAARFSQMVMDHVDLTGGMGDLNTFGKAMKGIYKATGVEEIP